VLNNLLKNLLENLIIEERSISIVEIEGLRVPQVKKETVVV